MIGPEVTVPDVTEAVVGYRRFALQQHTQHNFRLASPHQGTPWPTVEATARCEHMPPVPEGIVLPFPLTPHKAPHKDCGCGIYAYFEPCPVGARSRDPFRFSYLTMSYGPEVAALVSLSGKIEVHSRGMRAAKAKICALGVNPGLDPDHLAGLHEIARAMGVRVVPEEALPTLAPEYGAPLDKSMRPVAAEPPTLNVAGATRVNAYAIKDRPTANPRERARSQRHVPAMVINGGAMCLNGGLVIGLHNMFCLGGAIGSGIFAVFAAGRYWEARRG